MYGLTRSIALSTLVATASAGLLLVIWRSRANARQSNKEEDDKEEVHATTASEKEELSAYSALIGNTPMVKLRRLSDVLDCDVFVKMESLNPGGTGKDRAVKAMLQAATKHPNYRPGVDIVEGTSGSTGIALAFQCLSLGLKLTVVMPDDQAAEKKQLLEKLGAQVTRN